MITIERELFALLPKGVLVLEYLLDLGNLFLRVTTIRMVCIECDPVVAMVWH